VTEARIDLESMHLYVSGKGKIDLDQIIRTLKEAGLDAQK